MNNTLRITIGLVLTAAVLGLSYWANRPAGKKPGAGQPDELEIRSELVAKNLARVVSDPFANQDDLALSEIIAQTKQDYSEVSGIYIANLKDAIAAANDEDLVGQSLPLPAGIKKLAGEPILVQAAGNPKSDDPVYWAAAPILLGRERIGSVYIQLKGRAKTTGAIKTPQSIYILAGQAAVLALMILLMIFGPKSKAAEVSTEAFDKLEQKKKDIEKDLENKRKDLKKVEAEAGDHNRWLEMFRSEENDLASQVKKLREERGQMDGQLDEGRKQLIEFETLLREKQTKLEEVSNHLSDRIQEGIELDKRLERIQHQESELNQRMLELKKGEENLAQWLKQSKTEVQNLVQFIAEKRVEESELEQTIEERQRLNAELEERGQQMQSQIAELASVCEQWSAEHERLSNEVSEKQQNLTAIMQLLEGSRTRLEKLQKQGSGVSSS
jgi:predicted  nucleic acid-binding Zn-ribbon protein